MEELLFQIKESSPQLFAIFLGIGLAASAGFRVFVPLFALSLGVHLGIVPVTEKWAWVGQNTALVTLGIATFVEIFAYYIPFVDNLLDTIAVPLATVAGTLTMASTVGDFSPAVTWPLAIIAGGGTAAVIKSSAATGRLASSTTTMGLGNPIISTVETGSSIVLGVLSIVAPAVVFVLVLVLFYVLFKGVRSLKRA